MTRRSSTRQKLVNAANAAHAADAWIGAAAQHDQLAQVIGATHAASHSQALLRHERVRRRFPGFATALGDAFKAAPKLGRCLATPDTLHHLALMTGAGLAGGAMTRLVGRHAVSMLINALGQDVWAYGVEQGASVTAAPAQSPDQIIALIESEGCHAVFAYLEDTASGLGIAAFNASGLPHGTIVPPQDLQTSKSAVLGAMERVSQ